MKTIKLQNEMRKISIIKMCLIMLVFGCVGSWIGSTITKGALEEQYKSKITETKWQTAREFYQKGFDTAKRVYTPIKANVYNNGATIYFTGGEKAYLNKKAVENEAVKTVVKTKVVTQTIYKNKVNVKGNTGLNYNDIAEIKKDKNGYTTLHLCDEDYSKTVKNWEKNTGYKAEK